MLNSFQELEKYLLIFCELKNDDKETEVLNYFYFFQKLEINFLVKYDDIGRLLYHRIGLRNQYSLKLTTNHFFLEKGEYF